ncbi:aspartate/glutamate racemase family protein [Patescibacteria group bacterium]|nr:aspartate/glutamate racemase family protein [Patescibacteria group bacterium]
MLGIFDSGIGGLSVLKVLKEKMPQIDVVYFGDIKNAPYGIKTQEELKKLTAKGVEILLKNGAVNILSACNSISTFMILDDLKELSEKSFGIVEMINPTVEQFAKKWVSGAHQNKIMIFATPATIESKTYQNNFKKEGIEIETFAIPDLAGAIEFGSEEKEIEEIVDRAVSKSLEKDFETALLCCTHYPFVKDKFEKAFAKNNKKISIFNPAEAVVNSAIKKFNLNVPSSLRASERSGEAWQSRKNGKIKFLISQDSPTFRQKVKELFNEFEYSIEVI